MKQPPLCPRSLMLGELNATLISLASTTGLRLNVTGDARRITRDAMILEQHPVKCLCFKLAAKPFFTVKLLFAKPFLLLSYC